MRKIGIIATCTFAAVLLGFWAGPSPVFADDAVKSKDVGHFPEEWFWGEPEQQETHKAMVGKPAPGVKLKDVNLPELHKDNNKITLVDFWATWCGPCINAIPHMNEIAAKYKDQGVEVIAICGTRGAETMDETAKEHGMEYPTVADSDNETAEAWNVMWWPTYALIDRDGIVRAVGLATPHVEDAVKQLLEEQPAKDS